MKKAILTLFGAACLCAAAALKPGYVRHGDLKPSDQVPGDYETVMSNYLATAGYVPSHVTNTLTIVSNVTVNTDHWHTNNVVTAEDHWVTNNIVQVSNVVTHTDHFITNNVTHNFTQNFVYNYTNNFYDVTNRYFYDTQVTTNEIWNVGTNVVYEPHYIVSNFTERIWTTNEWVKEYYNNVYITNHYTDVINNLYTNVFTTVWATNNLVTWATNVIYETTNLYVTTHEDHYVTNNLTLWVTNNLTTHTDHWVTNNFVDYTTHWVTNNLVGTNTTHEIQCVVSNFYDVVYETTNIYNNVYETTNIYNNVYETNNIVTWATSNIVINTHTNIYTTIAQTNREDYFVYLTEVTTNEVTQLRYITNIYTNQYVIDNHVDNSTNYYTTFLTDRIAAANAVEKHEIRALNKIYSGYKRIAEPYVGKYWYCEEFGHAYATNMVPIDPVNYPGYVTFPLLRMGSDNMTPDVLTTNNTVWTGTYWRSYQISYPFEIEGYYMPVINTNSISTHYSGWNGYWDGLAAFRVTGGYTSVDGSGTTNYITSTTSPALGDFLFYTTWGYRMGLKADGTATTFTSLLPDRYYRRQSSGRFTSDSGSKVYGVYHTPGKTGSKLPVSSNLVAVHFTLTNGTLNVWTTNWTHYACELVDFNDMARYGEFYTADDVVTSAVFRTTMEDAMLPYTYASYTNMTMAASYARKTTTDAAAISNYMNTADQKIDAAIATATDVAVDAKNNAYNYMRSAQMAEGNANSAAGRAQTARANAEFQYNLIQTFTNWFYTTANNGQIVTNMHVYNPVYRIETANYVMDLHDMSISVLGGKTVVMKAQNSYGTTAVGNLRCSKVGASAGGTSVHYGTGSTALASYGSYTSTLKDLSWSTDGYWYAELLTMEGSTPYTTVFRGAGGPLLSTSTSIRLTYYSGQSRTSTIAIPSYLWIIRQSDSGTITTMATVASYITDDDLSKETTARQTADTVESTARQTADTALETSISTLETSISTLSTSVNSRFNNLSSYNLTGTKAISYDANVTFYTDGNVSEVIAVHPNRSTLYATWTDTYVYHIPWEHVSGTSGFVSGYLAKGIPIQSGAFNPWFSFVINGQEKQINSGVPNDPYGMPISWGSVASGYYGYRVTSGMPDDLYVDLTLRNPNNGTINDRLVKESTLTSTTDPLLASVGSLVSWVAHGTRLVFNVTKYRSTATCSFLAASTDKPVTASSSFGLLKKFGSGSTGVSSPSTYTLSNLKPVLTTNNGTALGTSSKLYFTVTYNTGATERNFIYLRKSISECASETTYSYSNVAVYYVTAGTEASPTSATTRGWYLTGSLHVTPVDAR